MFPSTSTWVLALVMLTLTYVYNKGLLTIQPDRLGQLSRPRPWQSGDRVDTGWRTDCIGLYPVERGAFSWLRNRTAWVSRSSGEVSRSARAVLIAGCFT